MPHKVGRNWKWGNIVRPSLGALVRVVYGIWQKNGSKGEFGDFWETGKTTTALEKEKEKSKRP